MTTFLLVIIRYLRGSRADSSPHVAQTRDNRGTRITGRGVIHFSAPNRRRNLRDQGRTILIRPGFTGDRLVYVTRPWLVRPAWHSIFLLPRQAECFRWAPEGGGC